MDGGSREVKGENSVSRRGKKKTNRDLHQVHSFEKPAATTATSHSRPGPSRHNATREDKTMPIEPFVETLPIGNVERESSSHLRQIDAGISLTGNGMSTIHPAIGLPDATLEFATSVVGPTTLDGNALASTSYIPQMNTLPSAHPSRIQHPFPRTSYSQRSYDADIPSYPFSTFRQPPSGHTIVQEPQFDQGYPSGYPSVGTEPPHSTGTRRGWLQQQQQQQQTQTGSLGASSPYPSLQPPHSSTVSEQQRSASGFAAPSYPSGVASGNTGHENPSMLAMSEASFPTNQGSFENQQQPFQDHGGHGQGSIGPASLQRSHEYRPESSDPSSLGSSEWSSLPNLRLMRGVHGDALSTNTSTSQISSTSDRGKRPHSRAHLQKHLRSLQSEMVALKERVRVAESLYRDTSPGDQSISDTSSGRLYDSADARKPVDHFDMRDYRGDERLAQSSNEAMVESSNSAYSSSFSGYPGTPWRQHPYNSGPSQTASSSSSMSAIPPRRGTWKTGAGNVLVFNTAVASDTEQPSSANKRDVGFSGQDVTDEGDDDEDAGTGPGGSDDTGKRYQCLVPGCLKSFTTSGHARRHSRTHLGHKLFICPHEGCDSTFTRRDNCRQHQRARHHMTLPVPELTESETLENLILDRQQDSNPRNANTTV